MVRKKSYISRNFPPERNRVELAPVPSSTPRQIRCFFFVSNCSSITFSHRASYVKMW